MNNSSPSLLNDDSVTTAIEYCLIGVLVSFGIIAGATAASGEASKGAETCAKCVPHLTQAELFDTAKNN